MRLPSLRPLATRLPQPALGAQPTRRLKHLFLSFGPQHPAAHGILRIGLQLAGEVIQRADPQFGLLHRGSEKLMEERSYLQSLPYMDRYDYVANLFQEHAFCLAVEALNTAATVRDLGLSLVRVLFDELSRVLNHLLTLSATSLDLSAMGPIFWAFEEREQIMELFERVSGARMHTALYRPFNFDWSALTATFFTDLGKFLTRCGRALSGAFLGLLNNRVLKTRLASVGALSPAKLQSYGITGVIGRSAGLLTDLRLQRTTAYGAYWHLSFRSFTGRRGDNLDRFLIRIKEVVESFRLVSQAMATLRGLRPTSTAQSRTTVVDRQAAQRLTPRCSHNWLWALLGVTSLAAPEAAADPKLTLNHPIWALAPAAHFNARSKFVGMEDLIAHFRLMSEGYVTAPGFAYQAVEGPKGEMGVTFVSTGTSKPTRAKLRSPVAHNMHLLPSLANGVLFADFVATFCSLDIVLGEIDR